MFTGLIEKTGKIVSNLDKGCSHRLVIESPFEQVQTGESIAVNGVCLTLLPSEPGELNFDVSPETLNLTTLAQLTRGDGVNLERAMTAGTRFGGHYVNGHVDTTAQVKSIHPVEEYIQLELTGFKANAMPYLIPKGSITVEGVSLTINRVINQNIQLMLVPHTLLQTTLGLLKAEQRINIEFDYLARIVAHQLQFFGKLNCEV